VSPAARVRQRQRCCKQYCIQPSQGSTVDLSSPGVYAPVLSFFQTNNGELDVETFKAHVAYLAEAGVGPVICGSLGEAPMLNETERLTLVRA
jgi:hypothetical protein